MLSRHGWTSAPAQSLLPIIKHHGWVPGQGCGPNQTLCLCGPLVHSKWEKKTNYPSNLQTHSAALSTDSNSCLLDFCCVWLRGKLPSDATSTSNDASSKYIFINFNVKCYEIWCWYNKGLKLWRIEGKNLQRRRKAKKKKGWARPWGEGKRSIFCLLPFVLCC